MNQTIVVSTGGLSKFNSGPVTDHPDLLDDAVWILACSFIIFTMQTGFGLLEAGNVQVKNEVNIMVKNVVDVVFGGLSYWMFGYALSFGPSGNSGFCGWGDFFMDRNPSDADMGVGFATFVFQLSFATTATTIVSGAMAERTKLDAYILFSFLNTLVYCIPAHWIWDKRGFLKLLGCVDIAGSGCVHFLGAVSAGVAALLLGPRLGRYDENKKTPRGGNPTNALIGMFMLWWGWLAFNCGSTFGISNGKWKLAAKAAATTLNASMGGGLSGIVVTYIINKGKFEVCDIVNAILAALVAVTAGCSIVRTWEAVIIGIIGGVIAIPAATLMDRLHLDDPVGAVAVHGFAGLWGMLACGIFVDEDPLQNMNNGQKGLIHGGGFYLLGVQLLACVCLATWSAGVTFVTLGVLKITIGIRLSPEEELLGSDYVEHNIPNDEEVSVEEPPEHLVRAHQRRFSALIVKSWKGVGRKAAASDTVATIGPDGGGGDGDSGVESVSTHGPVIVATTAGSSTGIFGARLDRRRCSVSSLAAIATIAAATAATTSGIHRQSSNRRTFTSDADLKIIDEEAPAASPIVNGGAHTNLGFADDPDDRANNNISPGPNQQTSL